EERRGSFSHTRLRPIHKDDDASRLDTACVPRHFWLESRVGDVMRRRQRRVDGQAPMSARDNGQFEIQAFPEHVEHYVQVGVSIETGQRHRESSRVGVVRKRIMFLKKRSSSGCLFTRVQSNQLISLSWQ